MNASSTQLFTGLQSYWGRRTYRRIGNSSFSSKKKKQPEVRLGGGSRRSWKVKPALRPVFRVRLRIPSPVKLLLKLRDAYVNVMLVLAGEKQKTPLMSAMKKGGNNDDRRASIPQALKIRIRINLNQLVRKVGDQL
ncbi:hypothetical protein J5N97_027911 [Dioscorea zingiberensis]|uniref:Uncharacterized protein n=1 Tax=Dioscorea zingiberensis TaxID=325984 RepID=A0A9D5BY11_9LILI|nr:hypothetical protein J5N97_027911 [Dioscorea zingiberensis]